MIFEGELDNSDIIQQAEAYDSFIEARDVMSTSGYTIQLIGELNEPKERVAEAKQKGSPT